MTLGNDNGTDGQTDRRTDRVRRNMRPPPREEGRIKRLRTMKERVQFVFAYWWVVVVISGPELNMGSL